MDRVGHRVAVDSGPAVRKVDSSGVDPVSAAAAEIGRHFPERAFAIRARALFCYVVMRMNSEIATSTFN